MNAEQFVANVDRSGGPTACWPWSGTRSSSYGQVFWNGRTRQATHVALELAGRPLARGQQACHTCDNPPCVNPRHLFAGTQADNIADALAKGRGLVGPKHPRSLSPDIVSLVASATGSQRAVARRFGVAQSTVGVIRRGEHWTAL